MLMTFWQVEALETVEAAGRNLKEMEEKKGFTFNVGEAKNQYIMIRRRRKIEKKPEIELTKGKVSETSEYKFLGNWIRNDGTAARQIEEIERKTQGMVKEIKKITNDGELGRCATETKIILYEKTVVPSITYNLEM